MRFITLTLFLFAAMMAIAGCPQPLPPVPPGPAPADAGPSIATCASVCQHGTALGCVWAAPTPRGHTCEEVCSVASRILPWNVDCVQAAPTCTAADACQ